MFRAAYIFLIALVTVFVVLQVRQLSKSEPFPVFLRNDAIVKAHQTQIKLHVHSYYKPTNSQIEQLKLDYSSIWAHLNHLASSNDVEAGKEYYTEDFFRAICQNPDPIDKTLYTRSDLQHELHLMNWSTDGLVCTLIDSNVVLNYQWAENQFESEQAHIAMVLLLQGDYWRIDAMRVLYQQPILE